MPRDLAKWNPPPLGRILEPTARQIELGHQLAQVRYDLSRARAEVLRLAEREEEISSYIIEEAMRRETETA